jgi:hypothetical protein
MTDRRAFLTAVTALSAGAVLRTDGTMPSLRTPATSDAWLEQLKGKHRQLFDAPDPDGGTVLRHARGYLDVWRDAYGVPERDITSSQLYAHDLSAWDAMWAKYKLGGH